MAYTASGGLPGFFVFPALALEIVGGLAILVGWQTRCGRAGPRRLLRRSPASSTTTSPRRASRASSAFVQTLMFQKNLAIAGGLLVLPGSAPGSLSARRPPGPRLAIA